jgi:4-hydroxy-4-methyl-2-oxoglutarate aldolase
MGVGELGIKFKGFEAARFGLCHVAGEAVAGASLAAPLKPLTGPGDRGILGLRAAGWFRPCALWDPGRKLGEALDIGICVYESAGDRRGGGTQRGEYHMSDSEERMELLGRFQGLRLTDVCDAMDAVGLQDLWLMDKQIRPLWRDTETFAHRICGLAHTVRFVPTGRRAPVFESVEEHFRWKGRWYSQLARGPIAGEIRRGDVIVIDASGVADCGFIGSNNALGWIAAGARGAVTNGGARDTDELIKQRVPVYSAGVSRGIRPGRLELESTGRAVTVGGVHVRPGDVVLADGDGVIVVPIDRAAQVADIAAQIQEGDKAGRRRLYEKLGRARDFTVEPR